MAKNVIGFIILGIISIGALGLAGYNFLETQIFVEPEEDFPKVAGLWNAFDRNVDYFPYNDSNNWLFELLDNVYNDSEYISVNNTNTCISLKKAGLYRIQIAVLLSSIDMNEDYWIHLLKNGAIFLYLYYFECKSDPPGYVTVNAEGYIMSDGDDYIQFNGKSRNGDIFAPYISNQDFNQLLIEFIM
ncbi:MAG: hypothetical protein EU533_08995 [Promethearchaeota archaeon]|nr:MAG: hypothetical protein EU533_08995 [Candidatus Lokiarchaeota archaeon]